MSKQERQKLQAEMVHCGKMRDAARKRGNLAEAAQRDAQGWRLKACLRDADRNRYIPPDAPERLHNYLRTGK